MAEHTASVTSLAISSDDRYVVSGSVDSMIKVWQLESGKCTLTLRDHSCQVLCV